MTLSNYINGVDVYRMHVIWHGEFARLFSQFGNEWALAPAVEPPEGDQWKCFKDSAKVRFSCEVGIPVQPAV